MSSNCRAKINALVGSPSLNPERTSLLAHELSAMSNFALDWDEATPLKRACVTAVRLHGRTLLEVCVLKATRESRSFRWIWATTLKEREPWLPVQGKVSLRSKWLTLTFSKAPLFGSILGSIVGIGRGTVKGLVECGAEVIAVSRTQADLDSLQKEVCILCTQLLVSCGNHASSCQLKGIIPVCLDVSDVDAVQKTLSSVGRVDMLVNNAGVTSLQSFLDVSPSEYDK